MTAPIVTSFGYVVRPVSSKFRLFEKTLAHLKRPIRHHFCGSLWERIAEGKTR